MREELRTGWAELVVSHDDTPGRQQFNFLFFLPRKKECNHLVICHIAGRCLIVRSSLAVTIWSNNNLTNRHHSGQSGLDTTMRGKDCGDDSRSDVLSVIFTRRG